MAAYPICGRSEGSPITWVAVAIGGSALIGAGASYAGSKKQSDASKSAANLQIDQFGLINQQQQPFIQSGYGAMGRLNTLLGLNPNPNVPRMSSPLTMPQGNPGYRITPGGGVDQMLQMGPPRQHDVFAGGPGGDPRGGNLKLRQILSLRAQHGDTQAARMLGLV